MKKTNRNFTLTELLIVIAIIVILAEILLPALNKAREKTRTVTCLNNLKQQSILLQSYIDSYNDFIPPDGIQNKNGAERERTRYNIWIILLNEFAANPYPVSGGYETDVTMAIPKGKASLWICDSSLHFVSGEGTIMWSYPQALNYGLNYGNGAGYLNGKILSYKNLSETVIIAETRADRQGSSSVTFPTYNGNWFNVGHGPAFYHAGAVKCWTESYSGPFPLSSGNALFLDGHAQIYQWNQAMSRKFFTGKK